MPAPHSLLELRTSRDAEHTPETAVALLASLPRLKKYFWDNLAGQDEHLSFEILVQDQNIYFQCYCPTRLVHYIASLFQSSYPEVVITPLVSDPVLEIAHPTNPENVSSQPESYLRLGNLQLSKASHLSLKTYKDFKDTDPLAPVLSTLSKSLPQDQILIQIVVSDDHDLGIPFLSSSSPSSSPTPAEGEEKTSSSSDKDRSRHLKTAIRIMVRSDSRDRAELLLENTASAFQSTTQSQGNRLKLRQPFFKKRLLESILDRKFSASPKQHLSLEEIATLFHLPNKKLSTISNITWGKTLLGEPPDDLPIVTRDMDPEDKSSINAFARTTFKNQDTVYGIRRADRRRHMYVIGKTGTGKSTLLANMAINDLRNDEGLCVIDPHGDLVDTLLDYIPSHRLNDVVYFDPSDTERTVQINLFEGENVAHRELIASGIVAIFQKLYAYSWGPRLEYILRNALLTLLESREARMSDILDLLTNKSFRKKVIADLNDPILKNFWEFEFDKMPDRQRTDAIAPILNKVGQFVTSPTVRNVVNSAKSSFSIEEMMNEGKIILVNLSQGRLGEDNATLLGAMLITKIQLAAMGRVDIPENERRDFYLYVDEFQNFATESFNKILSEARKYRLDLVLANQYIAQIPEEVQKAIFGNCGTMLSFVMGADDAEVFHREFGGLYSTEDLVSLGRHQVINRLSIDNVVSHPFPAHTLSLAKNSNQNRAKVIRVSRERYAKKKPSR